MEDRHGEGKQSATSGATFKGPGLMCSSASQREELKLRWANPAPDPSSPFRVSHKSGESVCIKEFINRADWKWNSCLERLFSLQVFKQAGHRGKMTQGREVN